MSVRKPYSDLRLLIIDDDPQLSDFMRAGLKTHFSLIMVASGEAQARNLMNGFFVFHAIICDYHLTDGNGMSLYRWLRQDQDRQVPFVLISGHFEPDPNEDPAFGFLAKPFHLSDLLGVLYKLPI